MTYNNFLKFDPFYYILNINVNFLKRFDFFIKETVTNREVISQDPKNPHPDVRKVKSESESIFATTDGLS